MAKVSRTGQRPRKHSATAMSVCATTRYHAGYPISANATGNHGSAAIAYVATTTAVIHPG